MRIPIEVTARHIHIKRGDLQALFGKDYQLRKLKDISQPQMFACQETLDIKTSKTTIKEVRIVGPERNYTQIELSATDAHKLGLTPPVRESGDLKQTPGAVLIGPKGELALKKGVILARRHLHLNPNEAEKLEVSNGQEVCVEVENGPRALIFKNVLVRVHESFKLSMHVDTDEGNASGINKIGYGGLV